MKWLVVLVIVAALVAVYVVWIRPWLREKPWAQGFFAWIEPVEIVLFKKSETLLKARAKMALGILLTFLTQIGTLDITPLMPLVPDDWEPTLRVAFNLLPLVITAGGWIDEKLREDTTTPLEVVALPEVKTPEVAAAVAKMETANAVAVEAVKDAKAEGTM